MQLVVQLGTVTLVRCSVRMQLQMLQISEVVQRGSEILVRFSKRPSSYKYMQLPMLQISEVVQLGTETLIRRSTPSCRFDCMQLVLLQICELVELGIEIFIRCSVRSSSCEYMHAARISGEAVHAVSEYRIQNLYCL